MTRRIVALTVALTLILTIFIIPGTAWAIYDAYSCCSNGKPLNVRSGPGKEYPVIGSIPYGERVGVDHDLGHDYGALAWLADVSPDEVCVVHLLATLPQERGRGIAHKLLQACYDLARERGMRSVRLDATANNSHQHQEKAPPPFSTDFETTNKKSEAL